MTPDMVPPPAAKDPWWRTASWLMLGGGVGVVMLASLLTLQGMWMDAHGYVARSRLQDVRAADFYGTSIVGDCNHDVGLIRVLTLNRAEDAVISTWWHEAAHCLWLPTLPAREVEAVQEAYREAVVQGDTTAPDWNEWAAREVQAWCAGETGNPVVYQVFQRQLRQYCYVGGDRRRRID